MYDISYSSCVAHFNKESPQQWQLSHHINDGQLTGGSKGHPVVAMETGRYVVWQPRKVVSECVHRPSQRTSEMIPVGGREEGVGEIRSNPEGEGRDG